MPFPVSVVKKAALFIYSHTVEFLSRVDPAFFAREAHAHVAHNLLSQSWMCLLGSTACPCLHPAVPMALQVKSNTEAAGRLKSMT